MRRYLEGGALQKILLLGKNGQVGWELHRACSTLGEIVAVGFPEVDLAQADGLRDLIRTVKPTIIINAAAYTDVDKAESEPDLARKINALAPQVMAEEARKINAAFIHYSTDYVFDGTKGCPYTEMDIPNPINVYGATKFDGEQRVQAVGGAYLIFRTSWVYSMRQGGFVSKVLQWARQQETLRIVDDQIGNPTWARMLAEATAQVIAQGRGDPLDYIKEKAGLYHLAGAESCSRFEWAKLILELDPHNCEHVVRRIQSVKSSEFPTPAIRPGNTELESNFLNDAYNILMPSWKTTLELALNVRYLSR
jgi:dTDP-4-dehydrorhamnose reductase